LPRTTIVTVKSIIIKAIKFDCFSFRKVYQLVNVARNDF
ncbi:MAG: hypothetical protein ACI920_003120, partial [Saprospiraceae bacterium]